MKYIRLFDTEAEYNAVKDDLAVPNVSYCKDTDSIKMLTEHVIDFNGDSESESICLSNWDTNSDGVFTFDEAAAVKELTAKGGSIGWAFRNNATVTDLRFLKYFTGVKTIRNGAFVGVNNITYIAIPKSVTKIEGASFHNTSASKNIRELHLYWDNPDLVTLQNLSLPLAEYVTGKVIIPKGTLSAYMNNTFTGIYAGKFEERKY